MKVWITKYALTKGILKVDAEIDGKYAHTRDRWPIFTHEFARDRKTAIEMAEAKRKAKIASLKKQLAKLDKLRFS